MNCQKVLKLLPLYISDDLDGSEIAVIESHISGCLNCYREYQYYLKALRDLKRLGEKPDLSRVMAGFSDEVMARIAHDKGGPTAPVPRVTYAVLPRVLAAAAVLLLVITGFLFFQNPTKSPQGNKPEVPAINVSTYPVSDNFYPWSFDESDEKLDPEIWKARGDEKNMYPALKRLPRVQPVRFPRDF